MFPFYQRQKKLVFVFIGLVIATILVLYYGFHKPSSSSVPQEVKIPSNGVSTSTKEIPEKISIEFDTSLFNDPDYKNLKSYKEINVSNEEVGRENPFIPF